MRLALPRRRARVLRVRLLRQTPSAGTSTCTRAPIARRGSSRARRKRARWCSTAPYRRRRQGARHAFEQKYGSRVNHWRGSAEKIVSRAWPKPRARRHEADVFADSSHRIEALYASACSRISTRRAARHRGGGLSPAARAVRRRPLRFLRDGLPTPTSSSRKSCRRPTRTCCSRAGPEESRSRERRALVRGGGKAMGEEKGIAYFRKLAAMKPASPATATSHGAARRLGRSRFFSPRTTQYRRLEVEGRPVEWKPCSRRSGRPGGRLVALRAAPARGAAVPPSSCSRKRPGDPEERQSRPDSRLVDSAAQQFKYEIVDPVLALDEGDKWDGSSRTSSSAAGP